MYLINRTSCLLNMLNYIIWLNVKSVNLLFNIKQKFIQNIRLKCTCTINIHVNNVSSLIFSNKKYWKQILSGTNNEI